MTLRLSRTSISENGGSTTVTARLDRTSSETTTVNVSATAVSPAVAEDLTVSVNKTLTILEGQKNSTGTVTITANNNDADTPNKTVRVHGTADNSHGVTDPDDEELTITDDDAAPVMTLEVNPTVIAEAAGNSTVTVRINNGVAFAEDQQIALTFTGTASKGTDYTVGLERLTLIAGQSSTATTVTAVDDALDDEAETVRVTARHRGGVLGAEQTITITDDDASPVILTNSTILVDENETAVATLTASDADRPAEDLTWRITGGADRNRFRLTADGVLTFAAAQDYEVPGDSDGNGDYEVAVEVRDGANPVEAVFTIRLKDVDDTAPVLSSASVNGDTLTLTYGEALDPNSRPAASDFTVAGGNSARTVSNVAVSGRAVTLTLNPAVEHGDTGIRVSYRPGTNPIQDAVGNDAVRLSNARVTNNTGDTTAPTVSRVETTSRPERAATYAAGQEIAVTVTFSETVVVTGTPRLRLNVGGVSRTAAYRSGTGAAAVFVYVVADGESDTDGVSIDANSLTLNGGRIRDGSNNNALLTHDGLAANAGHKVDGVKPALAANGGAVVNGTTLTLTFGERLDGSSTPQASAFTVTGGDTSRTVTDVALSGSAVLLTVDPAVEHGETGVRVSYTVPTGTGSIPLQDVLGNDADRLSNVPVTNETPDTTSPTVSKLEITSEGPFLVDEGETAVATLTADDSDTATTDLIWTNTGGADSGKFSLTSAGVLTFSSVKDYETPDDADTDRTYEVTVQVSDGTDSDMAELLVTLLNVTELTAITEPASVEFPENSWSRVATFTASSEEDRAGIEWILGGTDRDHFSIDNPPGALRFALQAVAPRIFSEPPDFEAPVDPDAANTYELTLLAEAGSSVTDTHTFTVTVTDVDEEGALSLSSTRPALGTVLTAVPTDPDGVTAGTALWQWERSTGRNSWAVIDGAAAASYTPVAADTNTFLRVTATYDDQHGTGKTVSEVAPNVVTGLLLTGLTAETDDSQADTARGLYPAFDPQTLHYGIGCTGTDTLVLTVSAPANARVAVAGVQAASAPEVVSVAVTADSDVAIRVTDASGAGTTYVVHCLSNVFFEIETVTYPGTDLLEDLILFNRSGYFTLMDRNGVPRLRRAYSGLGGFAIRFYRIGIDGAYRYGFGNTSSYIILDEDFEVVDDDVRTVAPLTVLNAHDFQILEDGNYLVMSWEPATPDFSDIDLPYLDGADVSSVDVLDSAFQIVTPGGQAVFTWNSWGNMAIEDCVHHRFPVTLSTDPDMRSPGGGYAHINGMHVVDGVLVASMRGCSKVLGIDVKPGVTRGDVLWRMGRTNLSDAEWAARDIGPRPLDFINDPEGEFCGQHTARFLPNGNVFLFDNGVLCAIDPWTFEELGREGYDFSRAVEYALDLDNHEAVFVRDHSLRGERSHIGYANGNVDVLDNGDWLVSWGRVLAADDRFPDNEMATLVDPATGQEKLGLRFRELPSDARQRRITATVAPAEALAPQPVPLTAEFPASDHTSLVHTGSGDAPQVIVAFNQPVVDFSASSPSISVQGATIESVLSHIVAGEPANAYVVTLTPTGVGPITFGLVADPPCASGGICTAGGTLLSEVPASHVIRADTTPPTVSNIEVSSDPGTDRTYAVDDEIQVTVTFSETVEVTGTPELRLELGGGQRTANYQSGVDATLLLSYTVADGESDADGVSIEANSLSLSGGTIRDGTDNDAVLDHGAVTPQVGHKVDGVRPELAAGGGAAIDGTTLTLTYDEPLDGSSTPEMGDFTVSGGDQVRTVTGVRVNGSAVELTLDVGAEHLEAGIQVSYTPGDNPIQDVPGNEAETLSRETVDNDTPDTTAPTVSSLAITSSPGSDQTYAAGDAVEWTVRFSEAVEVEGTPQLRLRVGTRNRTAGYDSGTGTASLVFAYDVADGDEDTGGVSIEAGRIALNGGTIEDEADNDAVLDHEAVAPQVEHKVDGARPAFVSAAVDGASLTLTYDEALDGSSTPATGDFTVSGGDQVRTVTGVRVNGSAVELTLDVGAEHLEAGIQVSYTPGDNPIQDVPGNEAETLSRETVDNDTPDTTAPTVSSLAITSSPGSDQTYAAGDAVEWTVRFSETVEVEGTPQLRLRVGSRTRTAGYLRGGGTAALVFGYDVADGESDADGVSIEANSLSLSGGTIRDGTDNDAVLDHGAVTPQVGHKVDGVRPELADGGGAAIDGTTLTLTYDEPLDGSSTPEMDDFTVSGGDRARTVTGVRVNGSAVELTLDVGAEHGEAGIQVSYTPGWGQPDPGCTGQRSGGADPRAGDERNAGYDLTGGEQSGHQFELRI